MPWVKLDEHFPDHPKIIAAGPLAAWLYVSGLAYCNRLLTDGVIPAGQLRRLADVDDPEALAARLVNACLWERIDGGYQVHDFLDYQPSRERMRAVSAARAEAGRAGGKQKASKLLELGLAFASSKTLARTESVPSPSLTELTDSQDCLAPSSLDPSTIGDDAPMPSSPDGDGDTDREMAAAAASNGHGPAHAAHLAEPPAVDTAAKSPEPPGRHPPWPDLAWMKAAYRESFWPLYPRRTHKQEGEHAWIRLMRRQPSYDAAMALAERILEVVSEQSRHWADPAFTPEAGTYLNGRRWEDEHIIPTGGGGGRGRRR